MCKRLKRLRVYIYRLNSILRTQNAERQFTKKNAILPLIEFSVIKPMMQVPYVIKTNANVDASLLS